MRVLTVLSPQENTCCRLVQNHAVVAETLPCFPACRGGLCASQTCVDATIQPADPSSALI